MKQCDVTECSKPSRALGLCVMHYTRLTKKGTLSAPNVPTAREQFNERWIPEPFSGCHLWTHDAGKVGYGRLSIRGKRVYAHRFSWELHYGPIHDDMHVLHRCDTRLCVNPVHLFLGTQADNNLDCRTKGRAFTPSRPPEYQGEVCSYSKLNNSAIIRIRESKDSLKCLGNLFGVSPSTISDVRRGKTWRHLPQC